MLDWWIVVLYTFSILFFLRGLGHDDDPGGAGAVSRQWGNTCPQRPEALGNRRAGNTTGEWSAHKLPRRLGWSEVGRTGTGLRTAWEALLSATTPTARSASREAVASRIPSFGKREGKIPGAPEEPEPGANDARLLSPAL